MNRDEEMKIFSRERKMRIVEEGSKSEYWKILKEEVERHITQYDNYLNRLDSRLLTEKDLKERNDIIFQRKFMKWFLNINEKIMKDQEKFFDTIKKGFGDAVKRVESFVGRI